jgi:predicted nucleotidyltransferase
LITCKRLFGGVDLSSKLPEKIRRILPKISKELHARKNVSSMGLYGSWSRGDAAPSSDLDILVVDKSDPDLEYIERVEMDTIPIDLNFVPKKWLVERLPPFLDQKLYETNVFFDSDWSLTVAKNWIQRLHRNKGRIEIRTDALLLDSETYISRVISALSRKDYESASLFIPLSLEPVAKILLDILGLPYSNSRLVRNFHLATNIIKKPSLFSSFLRLSNLPPQDRENCLKILDLLEKSQGILYGSVQENPETLKTIHASVKNSIKYHINPLFISGVKTRVKGLIEAGELEEAVLYTKRIMISIFEDYGVLIAGKEGTKIDYTVLTRHLKGIGEYDTPMYEIARETFDLANAVPELINENLEFARDIIKSFSKEKNLLIDVYRDRRQ